MTFTRRLFRSIYHTLIYITVISLVIAAVLLSLARVMLPAIEEYRPDIELWVSDFVGQQIQIATLDAAWYGIEPQLVLRGVQLLSDDRKQTLMFFQQASIGLNIFRSLYERRFVPGALTLEGAHFVAIRQKDGSITIEGIRTTGVESDSNNDLLSEWLFKQRLVDVKNSELVWRDLTKDGKDWQFSDVNLRFRNNDDNHHYINGSVHLPGALGNRLKIAMDARGKLLSAIDWSGSLYLEGENIQIAEWVKDVSFSKVSVTEGQLGFRIWTQWRKAKLSSAKGEFLAQSFQISAENAPKIEVIESLASIFSIQKVKDEWEATFDKILVLNNHKLWPQSRLDLQYNKTLDSINAELSYLGLSDVLPIIKFFKYDDEKFIEIVNSLDPKGVLTNIKLNVSDIYSEPKIIADSVFSDISIKAWKKIPGFDSLDGQFMLSNNAGKITLPKQNFNFDYTLLFKSSAALEKVQAEIYYSLDENMFKLGGKDISLKYKEAIASGSFLFSDSLNESSTPPELDLAFYFNEGNVADAKYYIPEKLMSPTAAQWIGRSLKSGQVKKGSMFYNGYVTEFPFKNSEGLFSLNLQIEDGELEFDDHWPVISDIQGVFSLDANSLAFHAKSGTTLKSKLRQVDVVFPDFRTNDRRIKIHGSILGDSVNKLKYLHESPLENIFAKHIRPINISGNSTVDLNLDITLADVTKSQVSGIVSFKKNQFSAEEWKLDIVDFSSKLAFDNSGIRTPKIIGTMEDVLIEAKIDTLSGDQGKQYISIKAQSQIEQPNITTLLEKFIEKGAWGEYLTGTAKMDIEVNIPLSADVNKKVEEVSLSLNADISELAISLPYPLQKPSGIKRDFSLFTELSGERRKLAIHLGDIESQFEIVSNVDSQSIVRGAVGFGEFAELPAENGYRYSGHLQEFSWTAWQPLILPEKDKQALLASDGASGSQYFNVEVDKLELFSSWFGKTSIQASSGEQLWSIHLTGEELTGDIFIPVVLKSSPLIMKMDKLIVPVSGSENEASETVRIDPKKMPEIKISAKLFSVHGINFGELEMHARKIDAGLHLDQFLMKSKHTSISAIGDWIDVDEIQTSSFDIVLNTKDLGKMITSWGFSNAFESGNGEIKINADWPGKPSDFNFNKLKATADVDIKDTSLLKFEIGAAKMVGLLLPRRLLLDFRDVFKKGMHFDAIKGQYKVEDGNAFSNGLNLDGPVADIEMAGRIGLVAHDYDQLITVNRRLVGDSLSTIAAIATNPLVNPLLAAQVFALKKLFENQIDDILSVQYTIEGSWEDPKITPVVKNLENRQDELSEENF